MRNVCRVTHVALWLLGWILLALWVGFYEFAPASWWVSDMVMVVDDGVAGSKSPDVTLTVNYEKDVFIHWTRILLKQSESADWVPACDLSGAQEAYSGAQIVKTTLHDLFEGHACSQTLVPGEYYVEADLEWTDGVTRDSSVDSNIFTIAPPPGRHPAYTQVPAAPKSATRRYHLRPPASRLPWPFNLFVRR